MAYGDTDKGMEKGITTKIEKMPLEAQREAVRRYDDLRVAEGLKPQSRYSTIYALFTLAKFVEKAFEDITKDDLIAFSKHLSKSYARNTKSTMEAQVKKFYRWLEGDDEEYPKKVRWLRPSNKGNEITAQDLLTHEEIASLVKACDNPRDHALVMVLWESAARAGELRGMKIGSFDVGKYCMRVNLKGKTGHRQVLIPKAQPYVQAWLNLHPMKGDGKAPIWMGLSSSHLAVLLNRLRKRAGVDKRVHPHIFRHSRLTELATKLKESELRQFAGWKGSSRMVEVYVHLSGRDVEDRLAEVEGLKEKNGVEDETSPLEPWTCDFCSLSNPASHIFCGTCGRGVDGAIPIQETISALMDKLEKRIDEEVEERAIRSVAKVIAGLKEKGMLDETDESPSERGLASH